MDQHYISFNFLILSSMFYASLLGFAFNAGSSCVSSSIFLFIFVTSSGTMRWIELLVLHAAFVFCSYTYSSIPRNLLSPLPKIFFNFSPFVITRSIYLSLVRTILLIFKDKFGDSSILSFPYLHIRPVKLMSVLC